jgi:hypothetical protein
MQTFDTNETLPVGGSNSFSRTYVASLSPLREAFRALGQGMPAYTFGRRREVYARSQSAFKLPSGRPHRLSRSLLYNRLKLIRFEISPTAYLRDQAMVTPEES